MLRENRELDVPLADVVLGDHVQGRPGEKLPVDETVIDGSSTVDESMPTGDGLRVRKQAGDTVIGATPNRGGTLIIEAAAIGAESTLSHIIRLVEDAQSFKAPMQMVADRVASERAEPQR